ncbi:MAG: hypothetical protein ABEI80_04205 [Haloplanus sp.]
MTDLTLADRIAMYIGGGLLVLAIPVLGIINVLAGYESPMYVYRMTQGGSTTTGYAITPGTVPQGAELVHSPLIAPNLRAYLVALGLIIFGLYGVYRLFVHGPREGTQEYVTATGD